MTLTHGGLFDGGGGLHLALEQVYGARTVWMCEQDRAASQVLAHRWPGVPNWGDVNAMRPGEAPLVDIISGGFPCQDISVAGRRAGLRPETRSGLWSKMHAVITDQTQRALAADRLPPLVVIENVRALTSATAHSDMEPCPVCLGGRSAPLLRALGAVLGDLAGLGFDAEWGVQAAGAVGLPHRRERVFIVAGHSTLRGRSDAPTPLWRYRSPWAIGGSGGDAADPGRLQRDPRRSPGPSEAAGGRARGVAPGRGVGTAPDPDDGGPDAGLRCPDGRPVPVGGCHTTDWGQYGPAIRRGEHVTGRTAPAPTVLGARGSRRLSPYFVEVADGLARRTRHRRARDQPRRHAPHPG